MVKFIQLLHLLGPERLDQTCKLLHEPKTIPPPSSFAEPIPNLDYAAPTSYWVVIEASLAIISACLPTLRPVFRGMSPESVIRSVRSVFSLNPLRSNGRKRDGFNDLERSNRNDSKSSTKGLNDTHIPLEEYGLEKKVTRPVSIEDMSPVLEDGMMVQKSFTMTADRV